MTSTRFTLNDFRAAAAADQKLAMLTCYDYTMAKLLTKAGVKMLLVGDSAANVVLGHDSTIPVTQDFLCTLAQAVRRGAPDALVMVDMPFGSCLSTSSGAKNVAEMVKLSGCDCVKIETTRGHLGLIQRLADAGIAVFAHLGLTPQSVGLMGGYKTQGRSAMEAYAIADLAGDAVNAGAAGLLLEAVPPEVSELITQQLDVPVIGCGAGPACHAHVVVVNDILGLSDFVPKFAPQLGDVAAPIVSAAAKYVKDIETGKYPSKNHMYQMPTDESRTLKVEARKVGIEIKGK
jgi:3-methyl-2-oxobutanoate hydroxymethyltransferase